MITQSLSGTGVIDANGGNANTGDGSGGGGRIAVYYTDMTGFTLANIRALGGLGNGLRGGAGTIFLKADTQEFGDLIVDNQAVPAPAGSTPLRAVGAGTSTVLAANVLTDVTANFPVPDLATGELGLIGLELNPNTAQDQTFMIIDNTATEIFTDPTDGDMTARRPRCRHRRIDLFRWCRRWRYR